MKDQVVLLLLCLTLPITGVVEAKQPQESPKARVLIIVDESVYPGIDLELAAYGKAVLEEHGILCEPRPDRYYTMKPPEIRALLKKEYGKRGIRLAGAIMAGPIPHALKTHDPKEILIPCPLYYEDFDAEWVDKNDDGYFEEIVTDRASNPTEIWTAWWVPPSMEAGEQAKHLKFFVKKIVRYHFGEITGRDQFLWGAGDVIQVESIEGWTVLLKDTMKPLGQKLCTWSRIGQDTGTFRPSKRKAEFGPKDFETVFTLQPWQHAHILSHGNQRGWYWDNTGVVTARDAKELPEWSLLLNLGKYEFAGANIITTSGCSNGNFRGAYVGPAYDRALPNLLLFSPHTNTVAFYGAASPQSTSGFPCMTTELIESLKSDGGSYFAEGYFKMRNHDYSWGLQHYFFRGGDEKILNGDPFARYQDSRPFDEIREAKIKDRISKMKWETAGPW